MCEHMSSFTCEHVLLTRASTCLLYVRARASYTCEHVTCSYVLDYYLKMCILTRLSSRRASEETEPPAYSELYSRDDSVMDRIVVSWIVNIICFSHKQCQPNHHTGCFQKVTNRID